MEIFTTRGSELSFADVEELQRVLSGMDTSVPGRTEGRRSHHRERYCITLYLRLLTSANLLDFPLRVVKEESPDFLFHLSDGNVMGLEITEAGTELHQRSATELERSPVGTLLEGKGGLRRPGEPLRGRGYVDDEPERKLSKLILTALTEKTIKLNRPHFAPVDLYELLIYDNSHLVFAKLEDLAPLLRTSLTEWQGQQQTERRFTSVSILRDSQLLFDCTGRSAILKVPQRREIGKGDV
ncbi:MAG TPA: hypothetical protein VGG03_26265 [Thermoanaerobaculia bacterium]